MISDAELAVRAAELGADVVRTRFGTVLDRIAKGPGDFATAADLEAEQRIRDLIRAERPGDAVLGEEHGLTGSGERTWLVDPLCGTANFAARTHLVAVNVALRIGAEVTAAAAADPFTGEVFWTDGAAARVRAGGEDRPLVPSAGSRIVDLNLDPPFPNAAAFRATRLLGHDRFVERFRPRVVSSTVAVAWVATGQRAAYVTDGDLRDSVHFAAGLALCRAAGCVVTGLAGQPLHTGIGGLVAAADEATHAALLELIRDQLDGNGPSKPA
ncbi:inositol monophosphatase family protein [Hamadaea tsunoensis]|uniref:inositol monophosphatase family protein n=1 Tax=Hamadaea tsunoensis TaxID=53368 RepID=UPI00047F319B|nr:inositol monophosphatase family protein [Hamadaea tsunoensis]